MFNPDKYQELLDEAYQAYMAWHKEQGSSYPLQPSQTDSTVGWKYVHLRNGYEDLARYNHREKRIVWPEE